MAETMIEAPFASARWTTHLASSSGLQKMSIDAITPLHHSTASGKFPISVSHMDGNVTTGVPLLFPHVVQIAFVVLPNSVLDDVLQLLEDAEVTFQDVTCMILQVLCETGDVQPESPLALAEL